MECSQGRFSIASLKVEETTQQGMQAAPIWSGSQLIASKEMGPQFYNSKDLNPVMTIFDWEMILAPDENTDWSTPWF